MTSTATPAGRPTASSDGWAIFALPPGERDLGIDELWQSSLERSRRRRAAPRRPRVVQRGATRASVLVAAVALGGGTAATVTAVGADSASAASIQNVNLRPGATGAAVRAVQRALGITADGVYGPKTRAAVAAFQQANGLEASGVVGPKTRRALRSSKAAPRSIAAPAPASTPASDDAAASVPASGAAGASAGAQAAVDAALGKVGAPYSAGAAGPSSFDCSGLTSWAFKQAGISIPRTSFDQYGIGKAVSRDAIQAGDLVFFNTAGAGASDVGIATGPTTAVSATTHGVMEHPTLSGYWGDHFVGARRVA